MVTHGISVLSAPSAVVGSDLSKYLIYSATAHALPRVKISGQISLGPGQVAFPSVSITNVEGGRGVIMEKKAAEPAGQADSRRGLCNFHFLAAAVTIGKRNR